MNAPLMRGITSTLSEAGLAVLRFNFRGVGASQGTWGKGMLEVWDIAAAMEHATTTRPAVPLGLAGWSFGATTSLRWHLEAGSESPWAGVAPGLGGYAGSTPPEPKGAHPARRLIVLGDRDQFATVQSTEAYAAALGADVEILPGSDHFFHFREAVVGSLLAAHFGGRAAP